MKNAAKFLGGSLATYIMIAACSSSTAPTVAVASAGGAAGASSGGSDASAGDAATNGGSSSAGASAGAPAMPTDGSRLKAVYLKGSDGSNQFVSWYDSQRDEECSFTSFGSSLRCVPPTVTLSAPETTIFSDTKCMSPALRGYSQNCSAAYGAVTDANGCASAVYKLAPADAVFIGTPTSCKPYPNSEHAVFYSGAEVPLSAFVAATKEHA